MNDRDAGYRGIWTYSGSLLSHDEYVYLHYSGGFATCTAKQLPFAYYSSAVDKTFFTYGGEHPDNKRMRIMVSYYDHATGTVPRPTIVDEKATNDGHDNASIMLDDAGMIWLFSSAHGTARPARIFRSCAPYCIDAFEMIEETSFSYAQPWFISGKGFLFLHTRYTSDGRYLYWMTGRDGVEWTEPRLLSGMDRGHYQISWPCGEKVGTAFNYHPPEGGACARTNLYYVETEDFGETWGTAGGAVVNTPLRDKDVNALVHDYQSDGLEPYLKDINYDAAGNPIILYVTSPGIETGPQNDPRVWTTAHWSGTEWRIRAVTRSDNNYDTGCLHVEEDGSWRIIGPTEPGPQPYNTGGEIAVWISGDEGVTWTRGRMATKGSPYNHTYARRPVNAHPDFYALWADGHGRERSESRLYFCDRTGGTVYRLPSEMRQDMMEPELCVMR